MNKFKKLIINYEDEFDQLMLLNEIKESIISGLFSDEKINIFIDSALEISLKLYEKYKDKDINKVISDYGYIFIEEPSNKYYYSRLDYKAKKIITTDRYDYLSSEFEEITPKLLRQLSIAHEFVHFLELENMIDDVAPELLYVRKKIIFGLSKMNYTSMIFELVAHQFAKLYTGLSFNPKYLTYVDAVKKANSKMDELEDRMKGSKLYYDKHIK